jgi:hypothetical protein
MVGGAPACCSTGARMQEFSQTLSLIVQGGRSLNKPAHFCASARLPFLMALRKEGVFLLLS